jgi:hypothetical protein
MRDACMVLDTFEGPCLFIANGDLEPSWIEQVIQHRQIMLRFYELAIGHRFWSPNVLAFEDVQDISLSNGHDRSFSMEYSTASTLCQALFLRFINRLRSQQQGNPIVNLRCGFSMSIKATVTSCAMHKSPSPISSSTKRRLFSYFLPARASEMGKGVSCFMLKNDGIGRLERKTLKKPKSLFRTRSSS